LGTILAMAIWVSVPVDGVVHGFNFVETHVMYAQSVVAVTMASLGLVWWMSLLFFVCKWNNRFRAGEFSNDRMLLQTLLSLGLFVGGCLMMILPACGFSDLFEAATKNATQNGGLLGVVSGGAVVGIFANFGLLGTNHAHGGSKAKGSPDEKTPDEEEPAVTGNEWLSGIEHELYDVLGVTPIDATEKEIKSAYYKLARDLHSDTVKNRGKSGEELKTMEKKMKNVARAYEILSDPEKRRVYNEDLLADLPKDLFQKEG